MSMQDTACSGYTVKASEFTLYIPTALQEKYTQAIRDKKVETIDDILNQFMPSNFPGYESAFVLKDEDTAEGLDRGVVYVIFQDEDLFIQTLTPGMEAMKSRGITPEFNRWTSWG